MKPLYGVLFALCVASAALGQHTIFSLVPPDRAVDQGAEMQIDLVALNPEVIEVAFVPPIALSGILITGTDSLPV